MKEKETQYKHDFCWLTFTGSIKECRGRNVYALIEYTNKTESLA